MAKRGHRVEVLTSCAHDYLTWANHYPAGSDELNDVMVHRLPVSSERVPDVFNALNRRVAWGDSQAPHFLQKHWMIAQGPWIPDLTEWLIQEGPRFDVIIFFTYLYFTTWAGLPVAAQIAPTVLHPTAHDEPPFWLSLFNLMLRMPTAYAFSTQEEAELVAGRTNVPSPSQTIGIGMDLDRSTDISDLTLPVEEPFILYVGRIDHAKGVTELFDYFVAFKELHPGPLKLVFVGTPVTPLSTHPDVQMLGYVDPEVRDLMIQSAEVLVHPSYFESFSLVLCEAWSCGVPVLVQGASEALRGQVERSGGGLAYRGFAEFEAASSWLLESEDLRSKLGSAGRRFVEENYSWDRVLGNYERFLDAVITSSKFKAE